jgi:hypothetical protein
VFHFVVPLKVKPAGVEVIIMIFQHVNHGMRSLGAGDETVYLLCNALLKILDTRRFALAFALKGARAA